MAKNSIPVKENTIDDGKKPSKKKDKGNSFIEFFKSEKTHKVTGLFLIVLSIYLFLAFLSYLFTWKLDDNIFNHSYLSILIDNSLAVNNWMGRTGVILAHFFIKQGFGIASFLFVLVFFVTGVKLFLNASILPVGLTYKFSLFLLLLISTCLGYIIHRENLMIYGGVFGYEANIWLKGIIGNMGTGLLLFFVLMSFFIAVYFIPFRWMKSKEPNIIKEDITPTNDNISTPIDLTVSEEENVDNLSEAPIEPTIDDLYENPIEEEKPNGVELSIEENKPETTAPKKEHKTIDTEYDPTLDLSSYKFPTLDLLDNIGSDTISVQKEELEANKNRIVETLGNYAIQIEKIKATIGPAVTLYEIIPAAGVRISKIKNLEDDIALSLSAMGIRIIAPIPGKGTIGIEVPNQKPEIVSMRSILSSDKFQNNNYALPFGLGKTISNESFVADLTKMPHILMAGATGQGKSVGLNAIITSLLYKKHPAQIKFVMIDPKKVELSLYSKLERHFLAKLPDSEEAIITDTRKVVRTLMSLNIEMDQRYDLLKDAQVRNIKEYNSKFIERKLNPLEGHRFLPYIVVVVDEFADLIMTAGKEIENPLTRLAQLARAVGIHLIIATQRPSVNIITGTIKANFPARIAYRVISKIDSRTILDTSGADQLVGRGDMLLATGNDVIRIQCAFIDTHEAERVSEFIGSQRGYPDAFHLPEYEDEVNDPQKDADPSERDELFAEAARIIINHQQGSTSLLQRKLKLGYNRAGRIIDQLEAAGIVGPFEGSKAREVRMHTELELEQFLNDLNTKASQS